MVTRIWKGKKESALMPYYCGQIWNAQRHLWDTVTGYFDTELLADEELAVELQKLSQTKR